MKNFDDIPSHIKAQLVNAYTDNVLLTQTAEVEAMMTFIKRKFDEPGSKYIFVNDQVANTRDELFHFGRIYAETMSKLESGEMKVYPELEGRMFRPEYATSEDADVRTDD